MPRWLTYCQPTTKYCDYRYSQTAWSNSLQRGMLVQRMLAAPYAPTFFNTQFSIAAWVCPSSHMQYALLQLHHPAL